MPSKTLFSFDITDSGCFEVISHKPNGSGYTKTYIDGVQTASHRHIWEECFGQIPDNMCICHKCDNRLCINPEHLFCGTKGDNNGDRSLKGRNRKTGNRGERSWTARLTEETVNEIRKRYVPDDKENGCRALAREFGVHHSTISALILQKTWKLGV